jgi:hypothetical protein
VLFYEEEKGKENGKKKMDGPLQLSLGQGFEKTWSRPAF